MLARIFSLIAVSSVFLAVTAMPTPGGNHGGDSVSQCNGGTVQCCNQYHEVETERESWKGILALLDINIDSFTGGIASNCSPLNVAAIGGNSCSTQQVCCQDNQYNGLINVGCTPINLSA